MYKCEGCGHLFEEGEQKRWVENGREDGTGGEFYAGCPMCGGDFIEKKFCQRCNEYCDELANIYCADCVQDIKEAFEKMVRENFTEKEIQIINDLYDGEWICG